MEVAWRTSDFEQRTVIVSQPLDYRSSLQPVRKLRPNDGNFRLAPSVGRFRFVPAPRALDEDKDNASSMIAFNDDRFAIKHRFLGHGRRDRRWSCNEDDTAADVDGQLTDDLGHEEVIFADHLNGSLFGNTYVHANRIRDEFEDGKL